MSESFTLKCNKCGNEITLKDDTNNKDYNGEFNFLAVQSEHVNIICKCENEVFIYGD